MATTVVNRKAEPGAEEVYIGRGSKWGNPFTHKKGTKAEFVVASRDEAVDAFREWVIKQPELMSSLHELKGKVLGCYCKPARCHGDVLAELADADEPAVIKEVVRDLFDLPVEYALAHCVSADAKMGAGIALEFRKRYPDMPDYVREQSPAVGSCIPYEVDEEAPIFNLVTKAKFNHKPTLATLRASLEEMVEQAEELDVSCIGMPLIGSGLDKLKWTDVRGIIDDVTSGTGIKIVICHLPNPKLKPFRVIIAGGRHFDDYELLARKAGKILSGIKKRQIIIRSGEASGADKLGEDFANENCYALESFPADWKRGYKGKGTYDKSAGYKRNVEMATGNKEFPAQASALIAFWDGKSHGTKHMIDIAKKLGMKVRVVRYDQYN